MLRGFTRTVILFSVTTFIPHRIKRRRLPPTTKICFGKVKKSVVMVRKNKGNNKYITAVAIVAIEDRSPLAFLYI